MWNASAATGVGHGLAGRREDRVEHPSPSPAPAHTESPLQRTTVRQRQADREDGALSFARAVDADRAAGELDEVADDGEAQAEAAARADRAAVGSAEGFEDVRQELRADAFAAVAHHDLGLLASPLQPDARIATLGGELDRVGEQVPDDL